VCKICIYNENNKKILFASFASAKVLTQTLEEEEVEEAVVAVVEELEEALEVDYTVSCERCLSEILYKESVKYNEQLFCEGCAYDYDEELLGPHSEEQRREIYKYAEQHNLTIEEAIDYQTHCHCCGNEVTTPVFDADNHQYCKERCFEYCGEYRYECSRGQECRVCNLWEYHKTRNNMYAQMYDSIDMSEYHEPE